jgi:hypothetical protein
MVNHEKEHKLETQSIRSSYFNKVTNSMEHSPKKVKVA